MIKKTFHITSNAGAGQRLDIFLSSKIINFSRSQIQCLIDSGSAKVNGVSCKHGYRLKPGDVVDISFEIQSISGLRPEDIPLDVIYQDEDVLVINKPIGLVVHPGAGEQTGTLANSLLFHFPQIASIGNPERPGIVHRLDRETSGIMVVALSEKAYSELKRQFKQREMDKVYIGLVWGKVPEKTGKIDWALGRHRKIRQRISVKTRKPREALTFYSVLKEYADTTLLEIKPVTGRTHQIRVHFAAAGHPIVGDSQYGPRRPKKRFTRLFLHAHRLAFVHPTRGQWVEFVAPLPEEFKKILDN